LKTISIVTPCYNEQENVEELYRQVRDVMAVVAKYPYEHIFIDNSSLDETVPILRRLAAADSNVKVIINARNFGHIRSPMHALLQARGDAVLLIVADLQDPTSLIPTFIAEWEAGNYIESFQNFTGFGLYDRKVIELVRDFADPYPYFRGMLAEIGLPFKKIYYDQPRRKFGITKNNWYTLYDIGMLGIINHSKVPLRFATFAGFIGAAISFAVALIYLILKLIFWNTFSFGLAPMLVGVFFIASIQLLFLGVLGEYVGAIYTQVQKRPYAVELDRINFDVPPAFPTAAVPVSTTPETSYEGI